jgi:hypothetical protein
LKPGYHKIRIYYNGAYLWRVTKGVFTAYFSNNLPYFCPQIHPRDMYNEQYNKKVTELRKLVNYEVLDVPRIVELMKEIREIVKSVGDPLVVKTLRLVYENIEENGSLVMNYLEDEEDLTNLEYFADLLKDANNKYNRQEIEDIMKTLLGLPLESDEEEATA